jgi:hypothetical protein
MDENQISDAARQKDPEDPTEAESGVEHSVTPSKAEETDPRQKNPEESAETGVELNQEIFGTESRPRVKKCERGPINLDDLIGKKGFSLNADQLPELPPTLPPPPPPPPPRKTLMGDRIKEQQVLHLS